MDKIGNIIRKHRMAKKLTQEELGKKVFVSKQAVSKWETGKTIPDIEMIRNLCDILQIDKDEILGGSIEETRIKRKWVRICIVIAVISVLVASFIGLGGIDYISRRTQSGIAYLTVFSNRELLTADKYTVSSEIKCENYKNGYRLPADYGEIKGRIRLPDGNEIEFGFVNINNWHNIQIRVDIEKQNEQLKVVQTVCYQTDDHTLEVIVTEAQTAEKFVSVFREGV